MHPVFPVTLFFTCASAPVHASRVPPHRCPCTIVSGAVASVPQPFDHQPLSRTSVDCSSFLFPSKLISFSFWLRPLPVKQMRRRLGYSNRRWTLGLITHYFRVWGSSRRPVNSCLNLTASIVYSSSGSNSVTQVQFQPLFLKLKLVSFSYVLILFPTHVIQERIFLVIAFSKPDLCWLNFFFIFWMMKWFYIVFMLSMYIQTELMWSFVLNLAVEPVVLFIILSYLHVWSRFSYLFF